MCLILYLLLESLVNSNPKWSLTSQVTVWWSVTMLHCHYTGRVCTHKRVFVVHEFPFV